MDTPNKNYQYLNFWESFLSKERSTLSRYLFAMIISVLSLLLVFAFRNLEESVPFTSFAILTVILSAIYGGKGPATVDTLITSIGLDYFFAEPYFKVFNTISSVSRIVIYMSVGYLTASLVESLKMSLLISRTQKLEVEVEKKARENVLGVVSHDLRSPLASVIMNADLLLRGINSGKVPASSSKIVNNIKNSAYRMNRLIEDLLDAVKVEAGQFKMDKSECDIAEVVQTSIEESTAAANNKNIVIKTNFADTPHCVSCDQARIIQVINNLLGNAIKFSPNDSEVNVSIVDHEHEIIIRVKDQGPGISREDINYLFDRYWQAKTTAHKGTGLGLFISKSIIEQHDGDIRVHSHLGEGAFFDVHLPKLRLETIEDRSLLLH